MPSYRLFIFEGRKTEPQIFESLKKYYLNDQGQDGNPTVELKAIYGSNLYNLYDSMKIEDGSVDTFSLFKEREKDKPLADRVLEGISSEMVSEVYLIFDYDGHSTRGCPTKVIELLEFFNEETENGKLYISYPMSESIKHIDEAVDFSQVNFKSSRDGGALKESKTYKDVVSKACQKGYDDITQYDESNWQAIISQHCKKANFLVNDSFILPSSYIDQENIFDNQLKKHITPSGNVSVLSGFPLLICDYYGVSKLPDIIRPST